MVCLLDPLAEQAWVASGLWASLPGSLFVGTESDTRGHGLSHLKLEVDIGELIGNLGVPITGLINDPDGGQF
jgi:hypothetical protein